MEFGLRSLGNRSILCDPRFSENINKINFKIKKRDFWMPFTPTILKEDFDKFILNPKKIESRFMSMAFETTKKEKKILKQQFIQQILRSDPNYWRKRIIQIIMKL